MDPDILRLVANGETTSYLRLRDRIADLIGDGTLKAGARLPSERQMLGVLPVARNTLREALSLLEGEGLIYRLDRRGWFVSPPRMRYDPTRASGFTEIAGEQGLSPETRTLEKVQVAAPDHVAGELDVAPGASCFLIRRLRSLAQRPVLYEQIFVRADRAPDLPDLDLDTSLVGVLRDQFDIVIGHATLEMYPSALTGRSASILQVTTGTPGLFLRRTSYDSSGDPVEYDEEFWHHGAMSLAVTVDN